MKSLHLLLFIVFPLPVCFSQEAKPNASKEIPADPKSRFVDLAARYNILQEEFYANEPAEGEDGLKLFYENHPMNSMVSDFIALEQQSRGTEVGFSCLYHLEMAATSVGDADYPVTKGKVAALKILAEHYYDYPDIDTTLRYVFSGARVPESKTFLRALISSTRHDYVRANAMCELANYLALEANLPADCQSELAVMDREDPEIADRLKRFEEYITSLKDVDVDRNRAEATKLIEQLRDDYLAEFVPPRVGVRNPGLVSVKRSEFDEVLKTKRERIVDRLPAIQFELNHAIGQKAPPIDGNDASGTPMSLADFQGKVVVVMFSFKGCGPCEEMYPDNRKLIEDLSGEPFAFVGVQGDQTIDTVQESLESKTITWRVWWDGKDKRISTQWNIRGWPSTFVLDQHGIIRFRNLRGQELANGVRSLLKNNTDSQ